MSVNIFVYIMLYNLYLKGIDSISIEELENIYESFKNICIMHNDAMGIKITKDKDTFIKTIFYIFYKNELGTYIKDTMQFFPQDLMYTNIYNSIITKKAKHIEDLEKANYLSNYLYFFIKKNKNKKSNLR